MNSINTKEEKKHFFEVEQGSNYKVILTYEKEEIITFEQFLKLSEAIFKGTGEFITINKVIVQKRDIRMIEPTKQLTAKQKEEKERELEERQKEDLRNYLKEKEKRKITLSTNQSNDILSSEDLLKTIL